jgi:hypothetical protein
MYKFPIIWQPWQLDAWTELTDQPTVPLLLQIVQTGIYCPCLTGRPINNGKDGQEIMSDFDVTKRLESVTYSFVQVMLSIVSFM